MRRPRTAVALEIGVGGATLSALAMKRPLEIDESRFPLIVTNPRGEIPREMLSVRAAAGQGAP